MLKDFIYLLYPVCCNACYKPLSKNERMICTSCRHYLPLLYYHDSNVKKIEKVFYGRIPLENATCLFLFQKGGLVQNLIHNLKYKGNEKIGEELGKWLGEELSQLSRYQNIDIVIPVPLHPKKLRKRGYNQVEKFGQEIAKQLNATYMSTILKKKSYHQTQTKRGRFMRWGNISETFSVDHTATVLQGKHILIVDDVVTTGATIEACFHTLQHIPNLKVSIATIAIAE